MDTPGQQKRQQSYESGKENQLQSTIYAYCIVIVKNENSYFNTL